MDSKPTKKECRKNSWLDDVDKLEIQPKKIRKDATKMKSCHGKPLQESQVKKNRKAKEKWSFVENDHIGRKKPASGKERKTWNSRCGTDIGVFEQVINNTGKRVRSPTAIAMTDGNANVKRNPRKNFETNRQTDTNSMEQETGVMNIHQENPDYDQEEDIQFIKEIPAKTPAIIMDIKQEKSTDGNANVKRNSRKNFETNGQRASNTYNSMEQDTVVMNIHQENPDYDQEEEIQIIKEIAAKTPAIINGIKKEKSIYQPKVVITCVSENAQKESQSCVQSTRVSSSNEELGATKETLISTPTDKYPAFPSNTQLPETPTHHKWHSLHFNLGGLTITPVGPLTHKSFSTSSEARETSRSIHYGASRSRVSLPVNNRSGTNTPQNNSSLNNGLFQDGTTPHGPSTANYFSVSSGADTGRIPDGASKSPISNERVDNTGRAQDGTIASPSKSLVNTRSGVTQDKTAASQSNSPANDRSNAPVNGSGDITYLAQDKFSVNYRSRGDMTRFTQDNIATSQSNSPTNDRSNTPVNERGDNTERAQEGPTASRSKSPVNNRSGDMTRDTQDKTATSQSNSPPNERSNTPVNEREDNTGCAQEGARASTSKSRVNYRSGDMTRVTQDKTAASQRNTPTNGSGDMTGHAQDGARASPSKSQVTQDKTAVSQSNTPINTSVNGSGDMTGRPQDGPTASPVNNRRGDIHGHLDEAVASQGNSPGNNERRNTTERANNKATDQGTKPPGNITITVGGGDLTLKNGELTAQIKINDICMKGAANDVTNFVKEATRAVHDLVK